jgi:membrane dipeptidase
VLSDADHRRDPDAWARALGISSEAVELYLASDVIDLHIDSFIWTRVLGYDLARRHGSGPFGARFSHQVDFPRALEARLSGATWVITTNPMRTAHGRSRVFFENLDRLHRIFGSVPDRFAVVRDVAEYRAARSADKHAAFVGIQGGNALGLDDFDRLPDRSILRITLVHLSSSKLGATSAPLRLVGPERLTEFGEAYVRRLNEKRILVDLAHIGRTAFFDALRVSDPSQPVIVTHTGVDGAHRHWRNLDDEQLRAVAARGGTVGIMYHLPYLGGSFFRGGAELVVDHLEHVIRTIGDDHASLGSDWDGAIVTPRDMRTCLELPRLVELMLRRGFSHDTVQKILGRNFLRTVEAIRG